MKEYGGIHGDPQEELHDDVVFSLNPEEPDVKEQKDNDPMWASASSAPVDWFYADE